MVSCIEKRSAPKVVLLATPEPQILSIIGEESKRNGTAKLTSRQIDRIIKLTRKRKNKR